MSRIIFFFDISINLYTLQKIQIKNLRPDGEIGRHAGLRGLCRYFWRESSSLSLGTKKILRKKCFFDVLRETWREAWSSTSGTCSARNWLNATNRNIYRRADRNRLRANRRLECRCEGAKSLSGHQKNTS